MLELAKRRLEHDLFWFGVTERFDESVLLLADAIGWRKPRYVRVRVNAARTSPSSLSSSIAEESNASLLAEMSAFNALDQELHEFALNLLERRIAAAGPDFSQRVARFKIANARHAKRLAPLLRAMPGARKAMQKLGLLRG
jgi:hypothetical protein